MKRVKVRLIGTLLEEAGRSELYLELEDEVEVVKALEMLPRRLKERILRDGRLAPDILVLVDGIEVSSFGALESLVLRGGEEIVLIPTIHGG